MWGLQVNAAAEVEKPALQRSGDIQVFSPEEVWALVRAAASNQDGAVYLTAAFTGLRLGELLALRATNAESGRAGWHCWGVRMAVPEAGAAGPRHAIRCAREAPDSAEEGWAGGNHRRWSLVHGVDDLVIKLRDLRLNAQRKVVTARLGVGIGRLQ